MHWRKSRASGILTRRFIIYRQFTLSRCIEKIKQGASRINVGGSPRSGLLQSSPYALLGGPLCRSTCILPAGLSRYLQGSWGKYGAKPLPQSTQRYTCTVTLFAVRAEANSAPVHTKIAKEPDAGTHPALC